MGELQIILLLIAPPPVACMIGSGQFLVTTDQWKPGLLPDMKAFMETATWSNGLVLCSQSRTAVRSEDHKDNGQIQFPAGACSWEILRPPLGLPGSFGSRPLITTYQDGMETGMKSAKILSYWGASTTYKVEEANHFLPFLRLRLRQN